MPAYVRLSTVEAARVLGVSRKTTHRMCTGKLALPEGWISDLEQGPRGHRYVISVPSDDPRLQVPPGAPETVTLTADDLADDAPGTVPAIPETVPGPVDQAGLARQLETVFSRLVEQAQKREDDWLIIATERETIGRLTAERDQARYQLIEAKSSLGRVEGEARQALADLVRERADRAKADDRIRRLTAEVEGLRAKQCVWWRRLLARALGET